MDIKNVKGTHDIILGEAKIYEHIETTMRAFAEVFNFSEFRTPIIEPNELFVRGVGESSDVVRKEMYTFLDKGNRLLALRPEFTASIVRSFVNNKLYATRDLPVKTYYLGPVFRYERPQSGRYRQFHQFGVESLGVKYVLSDAETAILGYVILSAL
ncbi:MAG: histidine--tRNA ligase, partial [Erysipelotrichia bacterium]|nr:histidine--tRNA ligase [Erysipelotrichia bacterium]